MLLLRYTILSQLEILHDYFTDKVPGYVTWLPSAGTRAISRNLGIVYKSSGGILKILAPTELKDDTEMLDTRLTDPFCLTFYVKFNEPFWSNFTTISGTGNNRFFFTNKRAAATNQPQYLHEGEYVSENDLVETVTEPLYPLNKFVTEGIQVNKINGTEAHENVSLFVKSIGDNWFLETKLLEEGLYEIKDTTGKTHEIFFLKEKTVFDGICHLFFNPSLNFTKDNVSLNNLYRLKFASLSTYWRYLFSYEKINHFEGLKVLTEDQKEVFDDGDEVIAINGEKMICFTSNSPIQVKEKMDVVFQLKKNVGVENRSEGIIINRLPGPEKQWLFRTDEKGNRYSDMYINL